MEGYLYLLKSKRSEWYYIGSTKDLKNRLISHNNGKVKSTKHYSPFFLVYYEGYSSYSLARKREEDLKKRGNQKERLFRRLGID